MLKIEGDKGITLIALVISIIVLLILAGVTINAISGSESAPAKANEAGQKNDIGAAKDDISLTVVNAKMQGMETAYVGNGVSAGEASTTVGTEVIKAVVKKYQTNNKVGKATIEIEDFGTIENVTANATISVYTTDFEIIGSITLEDGVLTWGEIAKKGPKPQVGEISFTLEDGTAIPEDGADTGERLKITFEATIEGGTIVSVNPGIVAGGSTVTYVTNGTEKEVTFEIVGQVGSDNFPKTLKVDLKDKYANSEYNANKIKNNATTTYGSKVTGYTGYTGTGVDIWRIFYADSNNIYLIADDYIPYTSAPNGKNETAITKNNTDYSLSFNNVYNDYSGSEWILGTTTLEDTTEKKNSLASEWLNKYFNYTPDNGTTYPNKTSTNKNIKAVAYLLDTNIWSIYVNNSYADYAIGSPTIEMYVESYKQSHSSSSISYDVTSTKGYSYLNAGALSSDYNEIYIKSSSTKTAKASAMWLASPSSNNNHLVRANSDGELKGTYYDGNSVGFCPLVCLNSNVKLEKVSNDEFKIITENNL